MKFWANFKFFSSHVTAPSIVGYQIFNVLNEQETHLSLSILDAIKSWGKWKTSDTKISEKLTGKKDV